MESPTKIKSNRVRIGQPIYDWEKKGFGNDHRGLLEGPEALINPKTGKLFITYSGSASWSEFYAIGALELKGSNPLNLTDWYHNPQPLFAKSDKNKVYGVGHASFTKSKDGKQDYIIYHAMPTPTAGWAGRRAHLQQFDWDDKTGYPVFGVPESMNKTFFPFSFSHFLFCK